jgi:hypothetical protein
MAGDGGRVPDVSEQREAIEAAVHAEAERLGYRPGELIEDHMAIARAALDACQDCGLTGGKHYVNCRFPSTREKPRLVIDWTEDGQGIVLDTRTDPATVVGTHDEPSDPASVLATLLAESPDATVAAIEALGWKRASASE